MTTHETSQAKGRDDVAVWLGTNQTVDEPDTDADATIDMLKGGALTLAAVVVGVFVGFILYSK